MIAVNGLRWFLFVNFMIMAVKMCSFNCRGLQSSVHELQLLSASFDVICLQELWLLDSELGILNNIVTGMHGFGVSPMDASSGFVRGRPHGGVGFLCKDNLLTNASVVYTGNQWSVALRLTNVLGDTLTVVNVYLPCDKYDNVDKYFDCVGQLSAFVADLDSKYFIVGDFNCDPRTPSPCGSILAGFCADEDLVLADGCLPSDSFTYVSDAWNSTSWLDHCLASQSAKLLLHDFYIIAPSSSSDHLPLSFSVDFDCMYVGDPPPMGPFQHPTKVNFHAVSDSIAAYTACVNDNVCKVDLSSFDVIKCSDVHCSHPEHLDQIDLFFTTLNNCLLSASSVCLSSGFSSSSRHKRVPGWSEYVHDAHIAAKDAFRLWCAWNKPKSGPVFDLFKKSRATYKYAIRHCRMQEETIRADKLASSLASKNYCRFWSSVSRCKGGKGTPPPTVGGITGSEGICQMWRDQYNTLFNSVSSSQEINSDFVSRYCKFDNDFDFSVNDAMIRDIINRMKLGKAGDHFGLQLEHFRYSSDSFISVLALCFSAVFCHGYMPKGSAHSVIQPVLKNKNGDVSDSSNYRPIALVSIFF